MKEFERHRPSEDAYSPIAFYFNFSHNLLKAMVVDALLRGEAWGLALNDLLTGVPSQDSLNESRKTAARTLMAYARSSPDTIAGRRVPVIVYDPRRGLRAFRDTIEKATKPAISST